MPERVDLNSILRMFLADLTTRRKESGNFPVPEEETIRLMADINAACARNMRASDWFPHHKKEKKP